MIKYHLTHFQNLSVVWHSVPAVVEKMEDKSFVDENLVLTDEHKAKVKEDLDNLKIHVRYLGLKQSLKYIATIEKTRLPENDFTFGKLQKEAEILHERIEHEIEDIVAGFIPADRVPYFRAKELFGPEVLRAFPSSANDVQEAGTCFAHGIYTACVFHLMRALEHPLRALAKKLGVQPPAKNPSTPLELRTWGDVIDKIITAVNARPNPKTRRQADLTEFYNKAADQFQFFKDAWRDVVMHTRSKPYGEGEAKDLIQSVGTFMKRLATKLKE